MHPPSPNMSAKILPRWSIPAAVIILTSVISVFTFMDITRQDKTVSRILTEKGASLIRALEAGARTGMRGRLGRGIRLQHLLEETARQPDILFIAVTDPGGRITAHSDPSRIGTELYTPDQMHHISPSEKISWLVKPESESSAAFVVYRTFNPSTIRPPKSPFEHDHEKNGARASWSFPEFMGKQFKKGSAPNSPQIIFLGLDRSPFSAARNKDRSTTVLVAGLLLLLGIAGFLALFWALGLKASRRMLLDAQVLASELKDQVKRTEKLAAVGSLAAGVAHEIRNPLSSIKGLATYFGSKFENGSEEKQLAEVMVQEADRLNRVITELLEFARPSAPNLQSTPLQELVEHSLRLVQQDAGSGGVTIVSRIPETLPNLSLDRDRVLQVLINLYLNAIQAMPEGGTLTITATVHPDTVRLTVSDTGKGIPEQDLSKIFDPYYTTKGNGTGLGLATVHKIMESHGGFVDVTSSPDQGTTFTLFFPTHRSNS